MSQSQTTVTYLGHSTLLITTPTGKNLLVDPFLTGNPRCPQTWKDLSNLPSLDMILLTHIHEDHCADVVEIAKQNPNAPIVAIVEACAWLSGKGLSNRLAYMNKGGTQEVAGIRITMTHADHTSSFVEADGRVVFGGEPAGYVLTMEDGYTLYISGDTALFGDMALIGELYQPTLAILPIGDHFTMGPREAAYAIKLLKAPHVIPVHYATFPLLTGTPEALTKHIAGLKVTLHPLEPGEAYLCSSSE